MKTKLNDLIAFIAVAEEESFTRAAARLSVSQSALSHTIKGLEERLGLRLLTRTTRSVSLTEIGRKLYDSVAPRLTEIESELDSLNAFERFTGGHYSHFYCRACCPGVCVAENRCVYA